MDIEHAKALPEIVLFRLALNIARGMAALAKQKIVHRDLRFAYTHEPHLHCIILTSCRIFDPIQLKKRATGRKSNSQDQRFRSQSLR
jgi:hypothetical protein